MSSVYYFYIKENKRNRREMERRESERVYTLSKVDYACIAFISIQIGILFANVICSIIITDQLIRYDGILSSENQYMMLIYLLINSDLFLLLMVLLLLLIDNRAWYMLVLIMVIFSTYFCWQFFGFWLYYGNISSMKPLLDKYNTFGFIALSGFYCTWVLMAICNIYIFITSNRVRRIINYYSTDSTTTQSTTV